MNGKGITVVTTAGPLRASAIGNALSLVGVVTDAAMLNISPGVVDGSVLATALSEGGSFSFVVPGTYTLTSQQSIPSDCTINVGPGVILDVTLMSTPCITATSKSNVRLCGDGVIRCVAASVPSFTSCDGLEVSVRIEDASGNALSPIVYASQAPQRALFSALRPAGCFRVKNPAGLRRWRRAFADALYNPPRILVLGDSLVAGIGSDGNNSSSQSDTTAFPYSMAGQLRTMFAKYFGGNEMGFIHAGDSRNTNGGSVVVSNTTGFMGNPLATSCGALRVASGDSITIPVPKCTDIDIFYYESNGANSTPTTAAWQHNTDAAGDVAVSNGGGNNVHKKTSVTGLSDSTHEIVISGTAGTDAYIGGIVYYTSAGPGVVVMRQGLGSANSGDLIGAYTSGTTGAVITTDAVGNTRMKQALTITEPDLAIIMVGHNDASNQALGVASTPSAYATHLSTMITTLTAAGACVLLVSEPDPPTRMPVANGYDVRAYWEAASALATDDSHVAHVRCYDVLGDFTTANAALLHTQAASTVHLSRMGYGDVARNLFALLTAAPSPEISTA